MLMAVNIGNSRISVGIFDPVRDELCSKFQIAADFQKTSDEYLILMVSVLRERSVSLSDLTDAILSSVVPPLTETVCDAVRQIIGKRPLTVGPGLKTGFPIRIDQPAELGGDMVANTAAALQLRKKHGKENRAMIVADLGTVTTVSAVNRAGEYVGCAIFPGIRLSLEMLHGKTAQLPNVSLSEPSKIIAKNSCDAIRSGVMYGHALLLDGFVKKFADEMKCDPKEATLVITGENADHLANFCKSDFIFEEELTLRGLYVLFCNNLQPEV